MRDGAYVWRRLSDGERRRVLDQRRTDGRAWHAPPHRGSPGPGAYLVTAACFEHLPHIGRSAARMDAFSSALTGAARRHSDRLVAWCVLPNHYHVLVETSDVFAVLADLGRLHGRTSHAWNGEDGTRGRQVFFRAVERVIRSERHLLATANYVHHNAVHHRHARTWHDWPWSSAREFLASAGTGVAVAAWREYPIDAVGTTWDPPEM